MKGAKRGAFETNRNQEFMTEINVMKPVSLNFRYQAVLE